MRLRPMPNSELHALNQSRSLFAAKMFLLQDEAIQTLSCESNLPAGKECKPASIDCSVACEQVTGNRRGSFAVGWNSCLLNPPQ